MQIKSDLFRQLNCELKRQEVKTKLDQACLSQKESLNVDINNKSLMNNQQKSEDDKKDKKPKKTKIQKSALDQEPLNDDPIKENHSKTLVNRLNLI